MKNSKLLVLLLLISLLVPTSASAISDPIQKGPGEWDYLGSENITLGNGTVVVDKSNYWSGGGDYKIRVS